MLAADFTDPRNERIINAMAAGLIVLGVLVIVATVWWWRSTRSDHPALAPLEVMGDRSFGGMSSAQQLRRLASVRPEGADPAVQAEPAPLAVNLELQQLLVESSPVDFADLREHFDDLEGSGVPSGSGLDAGNGDPSGPIDPLLVPVDELGAVDGPGAVDEPSATDVPIGESLTGADETMFRPIGGLSETADPADEPA